MEYVADRGMFLDLPFLEILATFERLYRVRDMAPKHDEAFHGPI
jgi:hypothetical protein